MNKIKFKRKLKIKVALFFQTIIGVNNFYKIVNTLNLKKNDEIEIISKYYLENSSYGLMLDVGAQIGNSMNALAAAGWSVYCFEPNPVCLDILRERSKLFQNNVNIIDKAVSDKDNQNVNFYISDGNLGISSLHAFTNSHIKLKKVKTITLKKFIKQNNINNIDFLKIDTEGHDLSVLNGVDWNSIEIETILCEYEDKKTKKIGYTYNTLCELLNSKGYQVIISEWKPIEKYGGNHQWVKFHGYKKNTKINSRSWGNIIATKNKNLIKYIKSLSI